MHGQPHIRSGEKILPAAANAFSFTVFVSQTTALPGIHEEEVFGKFI